MKKFLTIVLLVALTSSSFAEIAVKSFRKLENDLDARVNEPLKDQNGDVCAIIKVVTTQTGFSSFDCGQIGVVKTVQKPSEIWVYVPYGAKRITITHPQLGMIRDYFFTVPVEKATVYEMVLITGRIETVVVDEMNSQWLVINPDPADAMIYLDDNFVKSGMYQAKVKPGVHTYRVEFGMYHNEAGKIEIVDTKKVVNVKLKPAFGFFSVTSEPESGAKVIVEGKTQTKTTPFTSEALSSGEYTVQVVKEMYQPITQKVMVYDGRTTPINFILPPNFAQIKVNSPTDATIYINNQQKGIGTWEGRLTAGSYSFEARRDKHRPARQEVMIMAGDNKTIELQPTPIFGSLDVLTDPPGASIIIDGKDHGSSPNTIYNLPIGDCTVQLTKPGYNSLTKIITITDGKSTELVETLSSGNSTAVESTSTNNIVQSAITEKTITVNSNPTGAKLYIDGMLVGQTPYTGNLSFGNHLLRAEQGMEKVDKAISITQNGGESNFNITFAQQAFMESTNGLLGSEQPSSDANLPLLTKEITVNSNPNGSNLYIDGTMVGQTPYSGSIRFGNHILRIEKDGQIAEKTITILKSGGETNFGLAISQQPIAENTMSSNAQKNVRISSKPSNADVYIDGRSMGKTPIDCELAIGKHSLIITTGSKKNAQDIDVNSTSDTDLFFELFDCYSAKTITSIPSGATVLINGETKGTTPLVYNMLNKEDDIILKQKGFKPYKESIMCDSKGLTAKLISDKTKITRLFLSGGIAIPFIQKSSTSTTTDSMTYEFRIGMVKTTGLYLKVTTNLGTPIIPDYTTSDLPSYYYYKTIDSTPTYYTNRFGVVAGLMLHFKPFMMYAGAGIGSYSHYTHANLYDYATNSLVYNTPATIGDRTSISGLETDAGIVINIKPFGITIGYSSIGFEYNELTCGVGILF
jgi:hypothetical protein